MATTGTSCAALSYGEPCFNQPTMTDPVALCAEHRLAVALLVVQEELSEARKNLDGVPAVSLSQASEYAPEARAFLERCVQAFAQDERLWTVTLLERLGPDLNAAELARQLRPIGIRPLALWLNGQNRNGYVRQEFSKALRSMPKSLVSLPAISQGSAFGYVDPADIPNVAHEPIVYFLRVGDRVKIGYTTNLRTRITALALRPDNVVLLLVGGRDLEQDLHMRFGNARLGETEWFRLTSEVANYIDEMRVRVGRDPIEPRGQTTKRRWWSRSTSS